MNSRKEKSLVFWLFVAPALLAFILVVVIPFIFGIYYSFTNWTSSARTGGGLKFVGLQNYIGSFSDATFLHAFYITVLYTVMSMVAVNVTAFTLAMLVTSKIKLAKFYRVGFFVPNLIGGLILGYIWQFVFNYAIPSIGKWNEIFAPLANPDNFLLANPNTALIAMVIVNTWQYAGYIMMIFIAAIESIPAELHEQAQIDGASKLQRVFAIVLPMIAQAVTVTTFLTLVQAFKMYDMNVSLTSGGPSTMFQGTPILGTELLAMNIMNTAFVSNDLAGGQARAVLFFVVLAAVSMVQVAVNKKKELEQ